jgi:hypothetical protein
MAKGFCIARANRGIINRKIDFSLSRESNQLLRFGYVQRSAKYTLFVIILRVMLPTTVRMNYEDI